MEHYLCFYYIFYIGLIFKKEGRKSINEENTNQQTENQQTENQETKIPEIPNAIHGISYDFSREYPSNEPNILEKASKKFSSFPHETKRNIVIVALVCAYLLGIQSHRLIAVKKADYDTALTQ